ncbi:MAG: MBL fold metallo-hydrolase [Solirubrobacteraceae bacterium]
MAPEVQALATGVHRVVDGLVNWYIVEDGDEIAIVDAGWPRSWPEVQSALSSLGRKPADIGTVLLTHGHPDHLGAAERIRRETGAKVWAFTGEVDRVRGKAKGSSPFALVPSLLPTLVKPSATAFVLRATARGFMTPTWVEVVEPFGADAPLDLPGRPTVLLTPGHTQGHVSFLFGDRGTLITGDAFATLDVLSRATGPRLLPDAVNGDPARTRESLDVLGAVDADLLLPGHGEPYRGTPAEAVARARETIAA